jgi:hypothetical protein
METYLFTCFRIPYEKWFRSVFLGNIILIISVLIQYYLCFLANEVGK